MKKHKMWALTKMTTMRTNCTSTQFEKQIILNFNVPVSSSKLLVVVLELVAFECSALLFFVTILIPLKVSPLPVTFLVLVLSFKKIVLHTHFNAITNLFDFVGS